MGAALDLSLEPGRIRRIREGDRDAIRTMLEGTGAFKPHETAVALELVDAALTHPRQDDYHPYVLEADDGTVASYACFGKNPMTRFAWDLYWLATRQDQMGRGFGRRIVSFVEEEVRRRGGKILVIETASNPGYGSTREFYLRIGCTLAARLPDFYDEGDDKLVFMKRVA